MSTGTLQKLDVNGDTTITWDSEVEAEVQAARLMFDTLRDQGYAAFSAEGPKGEQGDQIRQFDPQTERIIMVPALQGG